ncbi:hypothetical protein J6590_062444 [Homalodisca vitripennis]|nr:hypothetical protein J6590_062444 [Homalodisca vitripennis]
MENRGFLKYNRELSELYTDFVAEVQKKEDSSRTKTTLKINNLENRRPLDDQNEGGGTSFTPRSHYVMLRHVTDVEFTPPPAHIRVYATKCWPKVQFIMEQLIEAIGTRPLLWNTDLEEYRDSNLKDTAWSKIAEQLEQNSNMSSSSLFELLSPSSNQGTFLVNALSHHEPLAMLPASTKPTDRAETMSQYLTDVSGGCELYVCHATSVSSRNVT